MDSAASKNGKNSGSSQFLPLISVSTSAPLSPRWLTALSSSLIDEGMSCRGSVHSPENLSGHCFTIPDISSLTSLACAIPASTGK